MKSSAAHPLAIYYINASSGTSECGEGIKYRLAEEVINDEVPFSMMQVMCGRDTGCTTLLVVVLVANHISAAAAVATARYYF